MKKPRVVFFDMETSALVTRAWTMWEDRPIDLVEDWKLLSFAWKVRGEKGTYCMGADTYSEEQLVNTLWEIFNDADVLIAHNAKKFDIKKAYAKFAEYKLPPPRPAQIVDTREQAKKHFGFTTNRLNDLGVRLGLGKKVQTGGFELWKECEAGNPKAWAKMKRYNKHDVVLLQKVYERLLPYMTTHPNLTQISGRGEGCTKCGSKNLKHQGYRYTATARYRRFRCRDCGTFMRERSADSSGPHIKYVAG